MSPVSLLPASIPQTRLSWFGIVRLGLVQTALGAIVVLSTSTLNRVMVVELALPAALPGALVGWHYALQVFRPRWGYGADVGARATPWIVGGMGTLALGGFLAAAATALMAASFWPGLLLALLAFTLIGVGVGAAGTSLLVLLAKRVDPDRRAPAATLVWLMMISGFILSAATVGQMLDPYSHARLVGVAGMVCLSAFAISVAALLGVEGRAPAAAPAREEASDFRAALAEVWAEPRARLFAIFIVVSMLAYSGQDLILEPFAGLVFGLTPGATTKLSGVQHGGVLAGMIFTGLVAGPLAKGRLGSLPFWTIAGCIASAFALTMLVVAARVGPGWPLIANVFGLGFCNGVYAAAAIGSMMMLAGAGREGREGTRMGLWGAGQALSMGMGGFLGAAAADLAKLATGSAESAYAAVFASEAALFVVAALLAARVAALSKGRDHRHADPRATAAFALGLDPRKGA